jgi:hypothetical protein
MYYQDKRLKDRVHCKAPDEPHKQALQLIWDFKENRGPWFAIAVALAKASHEPLEAPGVMNGKKLEEGRGGASYQEGGEVYVGIHEGRVGTALAKPSPEKDSEDTPADASVTLATIHVPVGESAPLNAANSSETPEETISSSDTQDVAPGQEGEGAQALEPLPPRNLDIPL